MEFNGVFHQAYDNYCYPLNEDELIINIKTGYDVKKVNIILGDPFAAGILGGGETWNGDKQPIIFKKKLKHQIWWTTTAGMRRIDCRRYGYKGKCLLPDM